MAEFNSELMKKVESVGSPEELLAIAKENNINLTEEKAKELYGRMHKTGELSDDELDNVAGGGCGSTQEDEICPACGAVNNFTKTPFAYGFFYVCNSCGYCPQFDDYIY